LIQERRWFELTLLSINDGVVATDHQGTANSNAAQLTSVASEELAGKPIQECFIFQQRDRELFCQFRFVLKSALQKHVK
jgi:hypothetical protein